MAELSKEDLIDFIINEVPKEKKKASIEFAKFIKNNNYHGELIVTEDIWLDEENNEIGDTEQLYSLFEQPNKTK